MKKIFALVSIVMCCVCSTQAQKFGHWSQQERALSVVQPMASTSSSSLVATQAHEHIMQSLSTTISTRRNYFLPAQEETDGLQRPIYRVGPTKPNEPGVPMGDAAVLLLFALAYVVWGVRKKQGRNYAPMHG